MSLEKLAYMANQIGKFFAHQKHDQAVASVAGHLRQFWDPRMRREILPHFDDPEIHLDPVVREAVERLRVPAVS
ncbi:MAG TPA: formate dehydrogenase subunit delta [Acetobacteraceae bacterium]|jgi:formate dehydrogenase subunit delta